MMSWETSFGDMIELDFQKTGIATWPKGERGDQYGAD